MSAEIEEEPRGIDLFNDVSSSFGQIQSETEATAAVQSASASAPEPDVPSASSNNISYDQEVIRVEEGSVPNKINDFIAENKNILIALMIILLSIYLFKRQK